MNVIYYLLPCTDLNGVSKITLHTLATTKQIFCLLSKQRPLLNMLKLMPA